MSLRILTHTARRTPGAGTLCNVCSIPIPDPPTTNGMLRSVFDGEPIAVIETTTVPHSSYRPGEKDSNERCRKA